MKLIATCGYVRCRRVHINTLAFNVFISVQCNSRTPFVLSYDSARASRYPLFLFVTLKLIDTTLKKNALLHSIVIFKYDKYYPSNRHDHTLLTTCIHHL